jgi:hypothetical protein
VFHFSDKNIAGLLADEIILNTNEFPWQRTGITSLAHIQLSSMEQEKNPRENPGCRWNPPVEFVRVRNKFHGECS